MKVIKGSLKGQIEEINYRHREAEEWERQRDICGVYKSVIEAWVVGGFGAKKSVSAKLK